MEHAAVRASVLPSGTNLQPTLPARRVLLVPLSVANNNKFLVKAELRHLLLQLKVFHGEHGEGHLLGTLNELES